MMGSQPASAASACGRSRPWVSEIAPMPARPDYKRSRAASPCYRIVICAQKGKPPHAETKGDRTLRCRNDRGLDSTVCLYVIFAVMLTGRRLRRKPILYQQRGSKSDMTPCRRVLNDQLATLKQYGGRRRRPAGLWSICVSRAIAAVTQ